MRSGRYAPTTRPGLPAGREGDGVHDGGRLPVLAGRGSPEPPGHRAIRALTPRPSVPLARRRPVKGPRPGRMPGRPDGTELDPAGQHESRTGDDVARDLHPAGYRRRVQTPQEAASLGSLGGGGTRAHAVAGLKSLPFLNPSTTGFGRGASRPQSVDDPRHPAFPSHALANAASSFATVSAGARVTRIVEGLLLETELAVLDPARSTAGQLRRRNPVRVPCGRFSAGSRGPRSPTAREGCITTHRSPARTAAPTACRIRASPAAPIVRNVAVGNALHRRPPCGKPPGTGDVPPM